MLWFLALAFLFAIGSCVGWVIEVCYRRYENGRWINPGFLTGPALPLYGFGLSLMYLLCRLDPFAGMENWWANRLLLVLLLGVAMTVLEYVTGIFTLKVLHMRLWDYFDCRWNLQGIICPKFSLMWLLIGGGYVFLLHGPICGLVEWLHGHVTVSFFIGLYYGVLLIDAACSFHLVAKIRRWATESDVVVRYEKLKETIYDRGRQGKEKVSFFVSSHTPKLLHDALETYRSLFQKDEPLHLLKHKEKKDPKHKP